MQSAIKGIIKLSFVLLVVVGMIEASLQVREYYINKTNQEALEKDRLTEVNSNIGKHIVAPHVVKIFVEQEGQTIGVGTAFYVNFAGKTRIITNQHICDQREGKTRMVINNKYMRILYISKKQDLCLIESDREFGLEVAPKNLEILDRVLLVGHPRGLPLTIREGHLGSLEIGRFEWLGDHEVRFDMITTITYQGNSGSPVTNSRGEVVGVLFAGDRRFITEGYMVPRDTLIKFLIVTYKLGK